MTQLEFDNKAAEWRAMIDKALSVKQTKVAEIRNDYRARMNRLQEEMHKKISDEEAKFRSMKDMCCEEMRRRRLERLATIENERAVAERDQREQGHLSTL